MWKSKIEFKAWSEPTTDTNLKLTSATGGLFTEQEMGKNKIVEIEMEIL